MNAGETTRDFDDVRGLVALAAKWDGCEIRTVRFYQQTIQRNVFGYCS